MEKEILDKAQGKTQKPSPSMVHSIRKLISPKQVSDHQEQLTFPDIMTEGYYTQ